jgi:UDP-N-acetylmuramate--alanine ligase
VTQKSETFFFCGIGGSGMMPLAVFLQRSGAHVLGSDRSYDQGKTLEKFKALQDLGITLFPQDGSGMTSEVDRLVVSSAIEETIPEVKAALDKEIPIIKRGALLAELFNAAEEKIAIAGTSGKSTTTGMVASVLSALGEDPSFVNGGEIVALRSSPEDCFSGVHYGRPDLFVAEMDESDGSIAHYNPSISLLNNIALDHKSMEELEQLFGEYLERSTAAVVVNASQPRVMELCAKHTHTTVISYGVDQNDVTLRASNLKLKAWGIDFILTCNQRHFDVSLNVPGRHNVENALAALGACKALGLKMEACVEAISGFKGIHRRMELVGVSDNGITVIDDFAHNPDKISASLRTLKDFNGRLIVMFQPHGFGPLRLMGKEIVGVFARYLSEDDILLMPEVYYAGGTVDRSVTAQHIINDLADGGVNAHWFETREECGTFIISNASSGDRVVIMGARDDTLHDFAKGVLAFVV